MVLVNSQFLSIQGELCSGTCSLGVVSRVAGFEV